MKLVVICLVAPLLASAATLAQSVEPAPLTNPKGQEPSDLVRKVMKQYGIEEAKPEFKYEAQKKTDTTPHTVTVTSAGRVATKTVTMNAKKSIQMPQTRGER